MKNTYFTILKKHRYFLKKIPLLLLAMPLLLSGFNATFAYENDTDKNTITAIPDGKAVESSVIYEAETYYEIVVDTTNPEDDINREIGLGFSEATSGNRSVRLPDPEDQIRIPFEITEAGDYVINIRLRTGTKTSNVSYLNPIKYSATVDSTTTLSLSLIDGSLSPYSPNFAGSYWGILESEAFEGGTELAVGSHYVDISLNAPATFGYIDYVEIVKINDPENIPEPPTPGKVENLTALVRGKSTIDIGWDIVTGADSYEIQYSTDGGSNFDDLATTTQYQLYYAHTGLEDNTIYTYQVRALKTGATPPEGEWSDLASDTTTTFPEDFYDVNHIATIGDDFALDPTPIAAETEANYIFDNGILAEDGTDLIVMPLGGDGGVSISGAYHINTLLDNETTPQNDYSGYEILGTTSGLADGKIADIAQGSATYNKLLAQITYGESLAEGKSLGYNFRAVNLLQGEADANASTDTATYTTDLNQFVNDLNSDINTELGTDVEYPVFLIQSANPSIAVAQYRAAKMNSNLYIASPSYFVGATNGGREHIGHYLGKVYKEVVFDKATWDPVSPINIAKEENQVTIEFNVIAEPLVFDGGTMPYGFEVYDTEGQLTITNVVIEDDNKVVITTDGVVGADATVRYISGEHRDSDSQASTLGTYDLYNWAISFEEVIENVSPEAPTGLAAETTSDTTIVLSWDALENNIGEYIIEYSTSDSPYDFVVVDTVDKTITDFEHTDLAPASTYYYRLIASNLNQISEYSDTVMATTYPEIPLAPTDLTAAAISDTEVDLTWEAVEGTITGYVIERATENEEASYSQIDSVGSDITSLSDIDLTAGTTYYYRVKAVNSTSSSAYSDVANTTTNLGDELAGFTAEGTSSSEITLSWYAIDGEVDSYVLESAGEETGPFTELIALDSDTSYIHTDLTADSTVYYRLKYISNDISSAYSDTISATTLPETPDAPTALAADAVSSSAIDITWTLPNSTMTGLILESAFTDEEEEYSELVSLGPDETSYRHLNIDPATTVYYRIKTVNSTVESEYSTTVSATTEASPLGEPTDLTVTDSTDSSISISWTAGTGDIENYIIESSATGATNEFTAIDTVDAETTTFTQTDLTADTTVYYRVKGMNSETVTAYSNIVSGTTLEAAPEAPEVPSNFTAEATDIDEVTLSWDAVTENVDGYVIEEAPSAAGPYTEIATLDAATTTAVRTVPSPGETYFYRIKATNGTVSSEYSTAISVVTSIDEALSFAAFNLYPNPSSGEFSIEIQAPKKETGFLKIYNTSGNLVFENNIDTNFNKKFSIEKLTQGLFIIEVKTKSYHQMKKLLIN